MQLSASATRTPPGAGHQLFFKENKGQIYDQNHAARPDVLFTGSAGPLSFYINNSGISYQLNRVNKWKETWHDKLKKNKKEIAEQTIYRVDVSWLNANKSFTKIPGEALPGVDLYYSSSVPNNALSVKNYRDITLKGIYNGIDVYYHEKNGSLKCDYIVAPYANYLQVCMEIKGADVRQKANGGLILETPLGIIEEGKPVAYQNGKTLNAKWVVKDNRVSFTVENYDPACELIIDPLTRVWGTYFGDAGNDNAYSCATDASGNVFFSGSTQSSNNIATTGAYQATLGGGSDAFLAKFDAAGVRQWSTYYGDTSYEEGFSCATDPSGNIFLAGWTDCPSSFATPGAYQSVNGGVQDAFLVKFNTAGVRQWCTYYGGTGYDFGYACATDGAGNVFLAGYTASSGNIATTGAYQTAEAGNYDAFLVKFNAAGVRQWGTYFGGTGHDQGWSCTADRLGNVFLTGFTNSTGNIATPGAHQDSCGGGGNDDAFLVKFNPSGIIQWATYYGGSVNEHGYSCSADISGNVFLTGWTTSSDSIATPGAFQTAFAGTLDVFLVKFNSAGIRQWGTYYGDVGDDYANCCVTDAAGNIFLTGFTSSSSGISTPGTYQTTFGGLFDSFLVKFDPAGSRQWATYYGGSSDECGFSCAITAAGDIFMTGHTYSSNNMASPGAYQTVLGSSPNDAFLVKFKQCASMSPGATVNTPVCTGAVLNFSATAASTSTAPLNYSWTGPSAFISGLQNPVIANAQTANTGNYSVTVNNGAGCIEEAQITVTVYAAPLITISSSDSVACPGQSVTLTAGGGVTYTWSTGSNTSGIIVSPATTITYTIAGTDINGCTNTASITQTVSLCTGIHDSSIQVYVNLYPNPTSGTFILETEKECYVTILNELGQTIQMSSVKEGKNKMRLDPELNGIYFVKINNLTGSRIFKLIKQ